MPKVPKEANTPAKTILLIDDEEHIVRLLEMNLRTEGYSCLCAYSGEEGLAIARRSAPDLIVLDVMLPGIDGIAVCRDLKRDPLTRPVPVIMLSAKSENQDTIAGLEGGADDYITKPFRMKELNLRIKAALRQVELLRDGSGSTLHRVGSLVLDTENYQVTCCGNRLELTLTEFRILHLLMSRPGSAKTRESMVRHIFDKDPELAGRTLDVHVRNIRKKLDRAGVSDCRIETLRGRGYTIVAALDGVR